MSRIATLRARPGMRPRNAVPARIAPIPLRAIAGGQEVVETLLTAARRSAELACLDPTLSVVDDATYAHCLARFDAPARCNEPLRRMLKTAAPWDPA